MSTIIPDWIPAWRAAAALLSPESIAALRAAIANDDPRLIQGATTTPPPLQCVQDWPVEAACALGFCGWQGDGLVTVAEVEDFFAKMCFEIDCNLGEPAVCRHLRNWYYETPRDEMRRELLAEIYRYLAAPDAA
jgi:hypothetical protein